MCGESREDTGMQKGESGKVNTKPEGFKNGGTYAAWHPSGRYIAFSIDEIQQFFPFIGTKPIEVSDPGCRPDGL